MNICTFGDSHSNYPWKGIKIPGVTITCNYLGATLMYTIGLTGLDITKYSIPDDATVIFCFGEIDCRCHIYKYKEDYQKNIDDIVEKYFMMIDRNNKLVPNLKICVYNVVPPAQKLGSGVNRAFPYLGTDQERQLYTKYMNSKLKEYCTLREYTFFDVYDLYTDENGCLSKTFKDANVHIKNPVHMIDFILKNLVG
jgi:hypothetical protein